MASIVFQRRQVAAMVAMTRERRADIGDDGDDLPVPERREVRGVRRINTMRERQNERLEEHQREPRRAKITETTVHRDAIYRIDSAKDIAALGETKRRAPTMKYLVFIALNFGMVEDERGILRMHPAKLERKERNPGIDEVARHYDLAYRTVQDYDSEVRRIYDEERDHADRMEPDDEE